MPYQPYDTGWIKSIYGATCLIWLLCSSGSMPHLKYEAYTIYYNNIFTPIIKLFSKFCTILGSAMILFGSGIIRSESLVFNHFNYVDPIFTGIKYIKSMFTNKINIHIGPPVLHCTRHNIRQHKASSGRYLGSYYARKCRLKRQQVIVPGFNYYHNSKNDKTQNKSKNDTHNIYDCCTSDHSFHPFNDASHYNMSWYNAISPHWTGGLIWNGAYVLGHQVVSVTVDPIFFIKFASNT
jgi:hypothetical protein